MNQNPKPTLDQAIALFQLTAQLRGSQWTAETFQNDKGVKTSLESLAETAGQIWNYLVKFCD